MPFHMGGFLEDIDPAGAFVNITGLADDRLEVVGDNIRVPPLTNIVALAGGADGVVAPRFRLDSPSLDQMVRHEVSPLNSQDAAAVEPDSPQKVEDLRMHPLVLDEDEILTCQLLSNPAAAQDQWLLVWFADSSPQPVTGGRPFTIRATGTTTLVANTFSSVTITFDENLLVGNYQVIGLRPDSLGCVGARVIFRRGNFDRPGALGVDTVLDLQHPMFRMGGLGVWGEFSQTNIPAIEYLSVIADTVETVHLDLIRTGG